MPPSCEVALRLKSAERTVQEMAVATTTSNAMAAVMPVEGSAGMDANSPNPKALKAVEHEEGEPYHHDRDKRLDTLYALMPEERQQHHDALAQDREQDYVGEARE